MGYNHVDSILTKLLKESYDGSWLLLRNTLPETLPGHLMIDPEFMVCWGVLGWLPVGLWSAGQVAEGWR